jgi:hypothetical protein
MLPVWLVARVRKISIICDECGREKGDANHWHELGVMEDSLKTGGGVVVLLGSFNAFDIDRRIDICGEECFHRHLSRLLRLPASHPGQPELPTALAEPPRVGPWFEELRANLDNPPF